MSSMFIGGRWVGAASAETIPVITTPGETIDVLMTEADVAVHPERGELARGSSTAASMSSRPSQAEAPRNRCRRPGGERVPAVVEYRDGTVADVVRAVA